MRRVDAPRAGWYPDPQDRTRLRWWDGLDWTDIRRAPPSSSELLAGEAASSAATATDAARLARAAATTARQLTTPTARTIDRQETQDLITEVRQAARSEIERAADLFSQRARRATRDIGPIVSEYTTKLTRLVRRLLVVAVILLIAWFVFQAIAQVTFFEWLGERIDNLSSHPSTRGPVSGLAVLG